MIELSKLLVYFHFRSVKLHYAYNLCQDLLTIENTDSDLKVHELHALCK